MDENIKSYTFSVNNKQYTLELPADMPLLWVLRDYLKLTGTKYGCGIGECGSCMVLISNRAVFSCQVSAQHIDGQSITTIEGISDENLHPVQQAWLDEGVVQCGYCQSGQVISAVSLYNQSTPVRDEDIDRTMSKVLCRCGTYPRMKIALAQLLTKQRRDNHE